MAIPTSTRNSDGTISVQLPAGTKLGQFEVRVAGTPTTVTRESTRRLFGDTLRSGRDTWASGIHNRTQRDVHGIHPWEVELGRWSDLVIKPSLEMNQGWGATGGKLGDKGMAWNRWVMDIPSKNQFGNATILGMSIMPHKLLETDSAFFVQHDSAEQANVHNRIISGEWDWVYEQIARNLLTYNLGNALIRIDWEANATWYPHGTQRLANTALHGRAVAHVAATMLQIAPGLRFSMDISSHVWEPDGSGKQWLEAYYPQQYAPAGVTVTHFGVCDLYFVYDKNIGQNPTYDQFLYMVGGSGNSQAGATLGDMATFCETQNLPLGIGEWGIVNKYKQDGVTEYGKNGTGDAPAYITHMHRWITEHPIVAYDAYWVLGDWAVNDLQTDLRTYYPQSWAEYKRLWGAAPF